MPDLDLRARGLTQILHVTDLNESVDWFERFGWRKLWDWGEPPTFGAVGSGGCEIFLCEGAQGSVDRLPPGAPVSADDGAPGNRGVWVSMWVDDVDEWHTRCRARDIQVLHPPEDMPWQVREMLVRHPDGHVFRVGRGIGMPSEPPTEPPLPIRRVEVPVRLEHRLAAVLAGLAAHKGMTVSECLEETLLHTFEEVGGGVASPHTGPDFAVIDALRRRHGADYDTHASYRFVETREV